METKTNLPGSNYDKHRNPYRVPEGYFSDLNNNIRTKISERQEAEKAYALPGLKGVWSRMRGLAGFAGAFGCLVLLAMAGFYFTGYKAQVRETDEGDMLLGYTLYSEDMEELAVFEETSNSQLAGTDGQFAQAVAEYLDTYGYGAVDGEAILASADAGLPVSVDLLK